MVTNRSRNVMEEGSGSNSNLINSSEDILAQIRVSLLGQTAPVPACHGKPPCQPAVCLLGNPLFARLPLQTSSPTRCLPCTPFQYGRMDDGAHYGADGRMVQMMVHTTARGMRLLAKPVAGGVPPP